MGRHLRPAVLFFSCCVRQVHGERGNEQCWGEGYTFEHCCQSRTEFVERGCWSMHFNFDLCCVEPYRPSERCERAKTPEERLWHCRMRPHVEVDRCLRAPGGDKSENEGTIAMFQTNYSDYVTAQQEKAGRELAMVFASERAFGVVGLYASRHFLGADDDREELALLCHGAKRGEEVRRIRTAVGAADPRISRMTVLGTDISPEAAATSTGDVIEFDFHTVRSDWVAAWDVIYSNTLDHAYHPGAALLAWRASLHDPQSLLVIHRSSFHDTKNIDAYDSYGGSLGDYCALMNVAGFEIIDLIRLPKGDDGHEDEDLIFAVKGHKPLVGSFEPLEEVGSSYSWAYEKDAAGEKPG